MYDRGRKSWRHDELERFKDSMAGFINQYDWDVFFMAEFHRARRFRDALSAKQFFMNRYMHKLYVDGIDVSVFVAVERLMGGSGFHLHGLIGGVDYLYDWSDGEPYKKMILLWREANKYKYHEPFPEIDGYMYVRAFDWTSGGSAYASKYITKELCDYDFKFHRCHKLSDDIRAEREAVRALILKGHASEMQAGLVN